MIRASIPCLALAATVACATDGSQGSSGTEGTGSAGTTTGSATGSGTAATTGPTPEPLPPLDQAPLTTDKRLVPTHEVATEEYLDPRIPEHLDQMVAEGWGDEMEGPGEPILDVEIAGLEPPASGPNVTLLTRFVHLADAQIPDDESPTRVVNIDNASLGGAFRPAEAYSCHIVNAAVRTINAVNQTLPLDFVVLGGDNADSAQRNEVQWFTDILDGAAVVHCDSGDDDDPVPGPDNDPKDPFGPVGLDVPWKWVTGNHDILVQGNFTVESKAEAALGTEAPTGTRDWSVPGGPVFEGPVVADPMRELLDRTALLELVAAFGDGHGIDSATIDYGKAYYTFDASPELRMVVVDSAAETGADKGVIHQADVDAFLRPALDQAEADGVFVIVTSHHSSASMSDGGGLGGTVQPDALEPATWQGLLGEYPNVVMHLAGHSHENRVDLIEPVGGTPYFEVVTAAIADWPHQMRLIEVRDEDNGFLSVTGIIFDYSVAGDPLAADGRKRGVSDYTTAWTGGGWGADFDRNVRLWWPRP